MARYTDIRRGAQLKFALDNYVDYLQNLGQGESGIGQGTERGAQSTVYVVPFGKDVTLDTIVETRVTATHLTALKESIDTSTEAEILDAAGNKTVSKIHGFRPARIVWFRNTAKQKTVETSKVTKLKYLKYAGDRFSAPFGRKTDNSDQVDAYNSIRSILKAKSDYAVNRVSLVRERFAS